MGNFFVLFAPSVHPPHQNACRAFDSDGYNHSAMYLFSFLCIVKSNKTSFLAMTKVFINVWPDNYRTKTSEFTSEYISRLLADTEVETSSSFDRNDVVNLMLLDQANKLQRCLKEHGADNRICLLFSPMRNYLGWTLFIECDHKNGSINPIVGKFFHWDRIESQKLLSFNELTNF